MKKIIHAAIATLDAIYQVRVRCFLTSSEARRVAELARLEERAKLLQDRQDFRACTAALCTATLETARRNTRITVDVPTRALLTPSGPSLLAVELGAQLHQRATREAKP